MARPASGRRSPRRVVIVLTPVLCRACWSLHPWIVRRVGVHRRATVTDGFGGAVRSARVRCCRSDIARARRRVRTATPWHRRGQCRPRPPTREQTSPRWPPTGRLPLLRIRTRTPPHEEADSGTPGNASHYRRRTRPRRPRHHLQLGAGRRADRSRGWPHPESRHQRPSRRRGRHRRSGQAHHGAHCDDQSAHCEGRRWGEAAVVDEDASSLVAEGCGDRRDDDQQAGDKAPGELTGRCSCWSAVGHASSQGSAVLPARMRFSICRRNASARSIRACAC